MKLDISIENEVAQLELECPSRQTIDTLLLLLSSFRSL